MGLLSSAARRIRAYHGSPHVFDKFDMTKVGSGDGRQAFSHGLYFTTDEGLARTYRDRLAANTPFNWMKSSDPQQVAAGARAIYGDNAVAELKRQASGGGYDTAAINKAIALLKANAPLQEVPRGRVYEVDLPDGNYIDWKDAWAPGKGPGWALYSSAVSKHGSQRAATEALKAEGWHGVRYKPTDMEGATNYAVWDDAWIDILRKYGLAGLTAGGLGAGMWANDARS